MPERDSDTDTIAKWEDIGWRERAKFLVWPLIILALFLAGLVGWSLSSIMSTSQTAGDRPSSTDLRAFVSDAGGTNIRLVEDTVSGDGVLTESRLVVFEVAVDGQQMLVRFQRAPVVARINNAELPSESLVRATNTEYVGATPVLIRDEEGIFQAVTGCHGLTINITAQPVSESLSEHSAYQLVGDLLNMIQCS